MATNEAISEARQTAMEETTTDKLEDVSPPLTPETETETQDVPEYRADVGQGKWAVTPSAWKVNDSVFLRLKDGKPAGPFSIVSCHAPVDRAGKWRYDVKDQYGKTKNISGSIIF